jgi:Na+-driven multidrug efflux pump
MRGAGRNDGQIFIAVFAYLFGIVLGFGEHGVWWGIVAGKCRTNHKK